MNRYAIEGVWIVGRIDPRRDHPPRLSDHEDPASQYFLIDASSNTVAYCNSRTEWCRACKAVGIDCEPVAWAEPNPKP